MIAVLASCWVCVKSTAVCELVCYDVRFVAV